MQRLSIQIYLTPSLLVMAIASWNVRGSWSTVMPSFLDASDDRSVT
jgi:hypothetical protein